MTGVETRHRVAIAGRVVDARTQRPLAGAHVELATTPAALRPRLSVLSALEPSPSSRLDQAISDARGRFVFLDLPRGTYSLLATHGGGRYGAGKTRARVVIQPDRVMPAFVDVALPPTTVAVTVTDGRVPVAHARVRLRGSGERAVTGADGRCELTSVEPGERTVVVEAAGFQPAAQPVEVKRPGATAASSVTLTPES